MFAIILIGITGSGTTYLSHYISNKYNNFVVFRKVTTRRKRKHETDGVEYCFIDENEFHKLIKSDNLLHIKFSDYDNSVYGVDKEELISIVKNGKHPIFTCHSLEESQTLKYVLFQIKIKAICIYIYSNEAEREKMIIKNGEIDKYILRYYMDIAFKLQAYQKKYIDCNYFLFNDYNGGEAIPVMDEIISSVENNNISQNCNYEIVIHKIEADIQRIKSIYPC